MNVLTPCRVGNKRWIVVALFLLACLGQTSWAQLANNSCVPNWYYGGTGSPGTTSYYMSNFVFNGSSYATSPNHNQAALATVGTASTNTNTTYSALPGQTCTFTITGTLSYYDSFGVWVDWNNNGTFETSERMSYYKSYPTSTNTYTGSFVVPASVTPGPKRMRATWDYYYQWYYGCYYGYAPALCANPCATWNNGSGYYQYYGDVLDFTLNVGYANDLAVVNASTQTAPPFAAGLNTITASVMNNGVNTISSFVLNYTITPSTGSVITGQVSSTATLTNGQTTTVQIYPDYNFPPVGSATVDLSVASVNNTNDGNAANNNASVLLGAGLSGTYTVGGSSPDFVSIKQASDQLTAGGTIGSVTFNIRPGTYTEPIYIAKIPGNSTTKPIVYQSENGNKNSVILQYSNTSAAAITGTTSIGGTPTLRLNNADFITFRNFTISALNTTAGLGTGIELIGATGGSSGCDNVTFDNMVFNGAATTGTSFGDVFFIAVNNGYHTGLKLTNNTFNNASIPFYHVFAGSTYPAGDVITGNTFSNFGAYGMRLEGTDGANVSSNTWNTSSTSLIAGVVFVNHNGAFNFRKNRVNLTINNAISAVASGSRTATGQAVFANNFIRVGGANGVALSASGSTNVATVHNTLYNATTGSAFTATSGSSLSCTNNIFYNAGGGAAFTGFSGLLANYNNLYSTGATLAVWNGGGYATLAAYKSASGQDQSSSSVPVVFTDATNNDLTLTTVDVNLYGIGSTSNGTFNLGIRGTVPDDIFGNSRSRTEVFMGAHQLIPVISFNPAPPTLLTGCANQTLTIAANAVVSYGAQLSYTWQRNGSPLLDGVNGVSGASTNTLTITGAQPSLNGGDYVLRVTATGGADPLVSDIISVVVNAPIVINTQPASRVICLGNETSMAVVASGTILGYQWQKDGKNIAGATSPIYVVSNAGYGVSGRYRCVMTGTCGTTTVTSNDAVVYVASNTLIGHDPEVMGAAVGSTGYLTVEVNATAQIPGYSPQFQWYQGGTMLSDNGRISGATTNQLTVRNMASADMTQNYYCVVTGVCGSQTSKQGGFYVSQISIQNQPQAQEVCSGKDASLLVSATSNIPNVQYSYQWKLNNVVINDGAAYSGTKTNVLTIKSAGAGAAGDYTCLVTANPTGANLTSNAATISVIASPVVGTQPQSQSVCVGQPITMNVAATGGTLNYQWKSNGVVIPGETGASYSVAGADASLNAAKITCEVSNNCGSVTTSEATITVNDKPTISVQPSTSAVVVGSSFTLSVTASNAVSYQWKKDGASIPGATDARYTLPSFTSIMAGRYSCDVTNACGSVTSDAAVLTVSGTEEEAVAAGFGLSDAQPTPTVGEAKINFTMPSAAEARISLSDAYGREIGVLFEGMTTIGTNRVVVNAQNLVSGVYTYTLRSGQYSLTRKMVVSH